MKLQVALDFLELDEAMAITAEIVDYIDIVEIGTPLIIHSGLESVRRAKRTFPQKMILADLKISDAGAEESQMALDAGADVVTVLATASDNTIKNAAKAVHAAGKELLVDLIATEDIFTRASQLKDLGADYLCLHTAFDDESSTERSYELLTKLKTLPGIKVTVAGGINPESIRQILPADPDVVIIGRGLTEAADKRLVAKQLTEAMAPAAPGKQQPIDLSGVAGLDMWFDPETGRLNLGDDIVAVEPIAKKTEALKPVLLDPDAQGPEDIFYAYRGVMRKADLATLESHSLRHDIIVIPPGRLGKEYAKTTGHGHALVPDTPHTFAEIYFVLRGTAHYLCQKINHDSNGKPEVLDAFCIVADAGDVVFIPPDYDHFTINATDETLIVGNWAGTNYKQTYDAITACRGACYYLIDEDGTLKALPNEHYKVQDQLVFSRPDYSLASGFKKSSRPYSTVINNLQYFDYLAGRGRHRELLDDWLRTHSFQAIAAEENPTAIFKTILDELSSTAAALTCNPDSPLGRLADLAVHIPAVEKASKTAAQKSIQLPGTLFEQALFVFFDSAVVTMQKVLNKSNADMMTLHSNIE
ncbi:MAG: orotidine 5'-phosphate decarboxylase [Pirellulales bacterium]|nr:orotidine 5'-phosphate decarboxylase [Pirellulales bacterium]